MRRLDDTLIVANGFESRDASQPRTDVWALPPPGSAQQAWQRRAMPSAPRGGCAYGVVLGQLVCAGGDGGSAGGTLVESYDPYTDVWTAGEAMPVARTATQDAAVGGRLYVLGGDDPLARVATD